MNLLVLMADEMSAWALGAYGGPGNTPVLDALAARSTRFAAAYTPSPICVPARASIATGRHIHETGHWSSAEAYAGTPPSWAARLRAVGHETVSIGKLHYRSEADDTGFSRQILPLHFHEGRGWVRALLRRPMAEYGATADMAREIGPGESSYLDTDRRVTAAACAWLAEPGRRVGPWAGFVSWLSPHYPLIAPPEFFGDLEPAAFASGPEPVPDHPVLRQIAEFFDHDRHFDAAARGLARASYHALAAFVDAQIGRVLGALEAAGLAHETVVIFTSDHGEMLGEKGFWGKSTMFESAVRVPLLVRDPGAKPAVRDDPVSLVDIAPTALGLAHIRGREPLPGRSLLGSENRGRTVISEYHDGGSPVGITMARWTDASGAWKYVHYAEGHPPQLFELGSDPGEAEDLAERAPRALAEGHDRLMAVLDPDETNARAHADQARRVEELGGREALLAEPEWSYTPVR